MVEIELLVSLIISTYCDTHNLFIDPRGEYTAVISASKQTVIKGSPWVHFSICLYFWDRLATPVCLQLVGRLIDIEYGVLLPWPLTNNIKRQNKTYALIYTRLCF